MQLPGVAASVTFGKSGREGGEEKGKSFCSHLVLLLGVYVHLQFVKVKKCYLSESRATPFVQRRKSSGEGPKELAGAGGLQGDSRGLRGKRRQPGPRVCACERGTTPQQERSASG